MCALHVNCTLMVIFIKTQYHNTCLMVYVILYVFRDNKGIPQFRNIGKERENFSVCLKVKESSTEILCLDLLCFHEGRLKWKQLWNI